MLLRGLRECPRRLLTLSSLINFGDNCCFLERLAVCIYGFVQKNNNSPSKLMVLSRVEVRGNYLEIKISDIPEKEKQLEAVGFKLFFYSLFLFAFVLF